MWNQFLEIKVSYIFGLYKHYSGWLGQKAVYSHYERGSRGANLRWYRSWEIGIMGLVAIFTFSTTLLAILLQL